jgi:hypothetical protein
VSKLPDPGSPEAPKYWVYETGGKLAPAIERYLLEQPLSPEDVIMIRAYFKQWIDSPAWDQNPNADTRSREVLRALRSRVGELQTSDDFDAWVSDAVAQGLDPL